MNHRIKINNLRSNEPHFMNNKILINLWGLSDSHLNESYGVRWIIQLEWEDIFKWYFKTLIVNYFLF